MRDSGVKVMWANGSMYADIADMAAKWPETKCPDLGDWSDTPHDELDSDQNLSDILGCQTGWIVGIDWSLDSKYHPINVDRERLLSYIED
jgi:hypothetical protein